MAERNGGIRSIPLRNADHARSVHDMRHQGSLSHSTGEGNMFRRLERLVRDKDRLERSLSIWVSQKERTEAQIASVERERDRLLGTMEPLLREEAERLEATAPAAIRSRRAG